MYRERRECALCNHSRLEPVLSLAETPLANEFLKKSELGSHTDYFPLDLLLCRDCGHVQLKAIVDPERLFRHYVYVSGTSPAFVEHFQNYAAAIGTHVPLAGKLVVDIGSNDGTFLKAFREHGAKILGVDPALEIAAAARGDGVPTIPRFFDQNVAADILRQHGRARVVSANNVFAHAEDLEGIARAALSMLDDQGIFVFEVSYLVDVVSDLLFDTIYHEHLSYHSVGPLARFFRRLGATLYHVERVGTHGGSIRCFVRRGEHHPTEAVGLALLLEASMGLGGPEAYRAMRTRIDALSAKMQATMAGLWAGGKYVVGFGAPAKMTTLCHELRIDATDLQYVADDSPWKQGLYTPGLRVPVVPSSALYEQKPAAVVIFAWNFAAQIMAKHSALKTKWIVPLPDYLEVSR